MKLKKIVLFPLVALALGAVALGAQARMSDQQVIAYIQQRLALGRSEAQIGRELMARGVTTEQIERIQSQYDGINVGNSAVTNRGGRRASKEVAGDTPESSATRLRMDVDRGEDENGLALGDLDALTKTLETESPLERKVIYGHNVFNENNLTFAPGQNLPTPQNYILGPGDEVLIDIWGENEEHIRQPISPEGTIMISQLGPIQLNGMTIDKANKVVKERFARKYSGVGDRRSDVNLTLGNVRSITIDVMGEVATPGTFRMSPFSTVFHALYNAGGINDIGSLRNIEVLRDGKKIAGVDIYDYLFKGKQTGNIRLKEGDVIIVPTYSELVKVEGNVKRPMYYEIKPGETVQSLINYAGGFTGDAYSDMVRLARQTGRENELVNINRGEYQTYRLKDGDQVTVGTILDRYSNRVELKGAVNRPGQYAIGTDIFTLKDLINKADGLAEDAYTQRVMLYREAPDLSLQVEAIDLSNLMEGLTPDIELRRNDLIVVASIHELYDRGELTIQGSVARPGVYPYAANTTVEDLIVQSGGLLVGASTAHVEVSRRVIDPTSMTPTNELSRTYNLSIENGLVAGDSIAFELKPYDVVTIFNNPGYTAQRFVTVNGEVGFEGPYSIISKNERLSDFIKRAGGMTEHAYVRGASLSRLRTEDEIIALRQTIRLARHSEGNDSIEMARLNLSQRYLVGIDLEKALANPGSEFDIVLRDGDRLFIPENLNTVTIEGEVIYPNTVTFMKGKKVKDYIDFAGGYGTKANKKNVFIVYQNGMVSKVKRSTKVEPGCQIIVPTKDITPKTSLVEVMSYITSISSLGLMAASIATMIKK